MASQKQIEANRRNAVRSTGPKTAEGKARSSNNALRHRFSSGTWFDQIGSIEGDTIEARVTALWEKGLEIDRERTRLMQQAINNSSENAEKTLRRAAALERYSLRVDSARRKLVKKELFGD